MTDYTPITDVVGRLSALLTTRTTLRIADGPRHDPWLVGSWARGDLPPTREQEERLRVAYELMLLVNEGTKAARAPERAHLVGDWFHSYDTLLDHTPIELLTTRDWAPDLREQLEASITRMVRGMMAS